MTEQNKKSLSDFLTNPESNDVDILPRITVVTGSRSKYEFTRNQIGIVGVNHVNGISATHLSGLPEPTGCPGVEAAAWKTEVSELSSEVGELSLGGDIELVIRTKLTDELQKKREDLGYLSRHEREIKINGEKYIDIEMFRVERDLKNVECGMPCDRHTRDNLNLEYLRTLAIYSQPFTALWRQGIALRDNNSKKGVGVSLEAEVEFEEPLPRKVIQDAFSKLDSRENLFRMSPRVDLQALVADRKIHLRHFFSSSEEKVEISPEMLSLLVIGNTVPQSVMGEMALVLEYSDEELPLELINDNEDLPTLERGRDDLKKKHGIEINSTDWYLIYPTLQYFVAVESTKKEAVIMNQISDTQVYNSA